MSEELRRRAPIRGEQASKSVHAEAKEPKVVRPRADSRVPNDPGPASPNVVHLGRQPDKIPPPPPFGKGGNGGICLIAAAAIVQPYVNSIAASPVFPHLLGTFLYFY